MKNKTWFIVLIILIVLLIAWLLLFKKTNAPTVIPGAASMVTPVSTTSTTTTKNTAAPATIHLNGGTHGTTTALVVGQKVIVSLADPINAGYQIDPLQYDTSIIGLVTHTHTSAGTNGTDMWEFQALKAGTTGVTITATQDTNKNSTITLFSNAMSVK